MASQFNFDNLRNVGQALVMHNSFDILPAIKLILGWDAFFRSASAEFEYRENVSYTNKNFGAEGLKLVKDLSVLGLKLFFPLGKK